MGAERGETEISLRQRAEKLKKLEGMLIDRLCRQLGLRCMTVEGKEQAQKEGAHHWMIIRSVGLPQEWNVRVEGNGTLEKHLSHFCYCHFGADMIKNAPS